MAETLRDFLIGYGFQVDERSRRQAEATVRKSETDVTKLTDAEAARREKIRQREEDKRRRNEESATKRDAEHRKAALGDFEKSLLRITGISTAIGAVTSLTVAGVLTSVQKLAGGLEQLHYAGQRAGSTPAGMSAFAYGISQLGGTVESATASLAAFGDHLMRNPQGFEQVLQHIGVRTRNAAGQIRDNAELAQDALQALGKRPINEASNYADMLGFDDLTRRAGGDPRAPGIIAQRRKDQAAVDYDQNTAAQDATGYEQSLRRLQAVAGDVGDKIESGLFRKIQPLLDGLADWLTKNGQRLADVAGQIADAFVRLATAVADRLAKVDWDSITKDVVALTDAFADAVKKIDGKGGFNLALVGLGAVAFSTGARLGSVLATLTALTRLSLPPWMLGMLAVAAGASAESTPGAGISSDPVARAAEAAQNQADTDAWNKAHGQGNGFFSDTWNYFKDKFRMGGGGKAAPMPKGQAAANAGAIADELRKAGLPDEAIAASLGSMQQESGFNPRAHNDVKGGHDALIQWDSTRWPKVKAWIENQGGDPYDVRWQARAYVAEGRARPGERLYDGPRTQRGFRMLEQSKGNLDLAKQGIVEIERFGFGEAGGRFANADNWIKNLPASAPASASGSVAQPGGRQMMGSGPRLPPGAIAWGQDSKGNPVPIAADGHALTMAGERTKLNYPLGVTPSIAHHNDNSVTKGDTNVTHNPTFNITSTGSPDNALQAARMSAGRGVQDLLRDIQGSGQ